jgi:hypothetical protein
MAWRLVRAGFHVEAEPALSEAEGCPHLPEQLGQMGTSAPTRAVALLLH